MFRWYIKSSSVVCIEGSISTIPLNPVLMLLFGLNACAVGPKCTYTQEGTKITSWVWFYKDKPADLDKENCN